ncbi:ATP-binding cassette domain-containing protein [Paenibacillus sp. 481]|nr:ATP-binding cassette domain-containing protein [Paenibacillus sp. 481]
MSIKRGEKIEIVGDNAAGKSTLVKFILGLYPAPVGTLFYNGMKHLLTLLVLCRVAVSY